MLWNIRGKNYLQMEMFSMEIGIKRINGFCNFVPNYIADIQAGFSINHTKVSLNLNLLQESFIAP